MRKRGARLLRCTTWPVQVTALCWRPDGKLIAAGFSEAAIAVNQAVHWIYPDKKVAPGHSSNLAVFGQKDD